MINKNIKESSITCHDLLAGWLIEGINNVSVKLDGEVYPIVKILSVMDIIATGRVKGTFARYDEEEEVVVINNSDNGWLISFDYNSSLLYEVKL